MADQQMNTAPHGFNPETDLPAGFWDFYLPLHKKYTPWQQKLNAKRKVGLAASFKGELPTYLPTSEANTGDWHIDRPDWASDQRNQMTGPSDDAELVVKMLNSGAPGVMLDLEDSMANYWPNLLRGIDNILSALYGELSYYNKKKSQDVGINESKVVIYTRARGLHLSQAGIVPNELTSASLFDIAMVAYQADASKLKHPLSFYIPKSESAEEALWWNELLDEIEKFRGWDHGYIKAMALVESHPIAFQMEEFIYNLKDHLIGLNLGRWDYMASLIHFNLNDPNFVLPDRNTIPHDVQFFQNVRTLIPEICHKRGILAIGGMTALFPNRQDAELNERALKVLAEDKKNEATCLMDGAWTGHPDQNEIALNQFPFPNQLDKRDGLDPQPDMRPAPKGVGQRTLVGTRAAVRTVIHYRYGFLSGKGASLINGYMEDLATDRIYRLMIAQRVLHRKKVDIFDDKGDPVDHTPDLITRLFDEELEGILGELPEGTSQEIVDRYRQARQISEDMIVNEQFDPI